MQQNRILIFLRDLVLDKSANLLEKKIILCFEFLNTRIEKILTHVLVTKIGSFLWNLKKKKSLYLYIFSNFLFQHRSYIKRWNSLCFRIPFNLERKKSIFLKKRYWLQEWNCLYTLIAMHFCDKQYIYITTGNIIL